MLWLFFSVVEQVPAPNEVTTSRVAGFDFGLNTFLTDHTGKAYVAGLYHRSALRRLRVLQSRKDRKPHGSHNRRKAAKLISRTHIRVADKRRDAHFKLAHELCDHYDVLCFEDLNIAGMKRLWRLNVVRSLSRLSVGNAQRANVPAAGIGKTWNCASEPFTAAPVAWF
ncbi:MAG: transposase [Anaerolineae bacterium]|nr:transposase [Anaerolineae bacterium]